MWDETIQNFGLIGLAILLLSISLVFILKFAITDRLSQITEHFSDTEKQKEGVKIGYIEIGGRDEIATLTGSFNKLGCRVFIAGGGKEAVELYKANKDEIDLVILDMIMPQMGGSDTYDRLKAINPNVKVLLSSGYSVNGQATRILERGCSGFIEKPFYLIDLSKK